MQEILEERGDQVLLCCSTLLGIPIVLPPLHPFMFLKFRWLLLFLFLFVLLFLFIFLFLFLFLLLFPFVFVLLFLFISLFLFLFLLLFVSIRDVIICGTVLVFDLCFRLFCGGSLYNFLPLWVSFWIPEFGA